MANWGDFCTYCGETLNGEFPRHCTNRHATYASPVTVGVALQTVQVNDRIGILVVQRGIEPFKGRYALPGGFSDNGETAILTAPRELSEETPLKPSGKAVYFSEAIGGSHNPKDPRSHSMYFYAMPVVSKIIKDFHNDEVQNLLVFFLSSDRKFLETENGDKTELCFSTHQETTLLYLQSL